MYNSIFATTSRIFFFLIYSFLSFSFSFFPTIPSFPFFCVRRKLIKCFSSKVPFKVQLCNELVKERIITMYTASSAFSFLLFDVGRLTNLVPDLIASSSLFWRFQISLGPEVLHFARLLAVASIMWSDPANRSLTPLWGR